MVGLLLPLITAQLAFASNRLRRCEQAIAPLETSILAPTLTLGEEHEASHQSRIERLRELQTQPVIEERQIRSADEPDFVRVTGVPAHAHFVETDGTETFRHYSPRAEEMRLTKILRAGPGAYYEAKPHEIRWYDDLTGVILHQAKCKAPVVPKAFRVGKQQSIDVQLPAGLTLLRLDDCTFLVPGNPEWQPWILDAYRSGKPQPLMAHVFRQIKAAGNLLAPLEIPFVLTRTWTGAF